MDDPVEKTEIREVGDQAVWSLSSCKSGYGVDQLRDGNLSTYWQSDGPQPHLINIQFQKKTTLSSVAIFADYKSDESYTPSKISVRIGSHFHDLHEVKLIDLHEPTGWTTVELKDLQGRPVRTFMVQVAILQNHQNGRDTHLRQIRIEAPVTPLARSEPVIQEFSSLDMRQYQIR